MKKLLLTLTAFVAVLGASAQSLFEGGWAASYEPVSKAEELKGVYTAVAEDGSVYVSGTYDKAFTFAGKEVADPEGLTSASIVKYNEKGEEQWAVSMEGSAVVYALDVDADGTLYAAGNFMDVVKYTGTDGASAEISSEGVYSAFIAKVNKEGKFEAVKVITPEVNAEIASKMGDPWGLGEESPLYTMYDPIYVTPNKIQVDGDNVYVSARYMGDVKDLAWKGSYIDVFGMMYSDNYSSGVFSLAKADLSAPASVANVQMTGVISDVQMYPDALSFAVSEGKVYVGFIGFNKLTLTTAAGATDFTFATTEEGALEHAFVLATIGETTTTKVYNVATNGRAYTPYNLFMGADGENLIIGGTFSGELPFDTQKTSGELPSDVFMASVKKADGAVNWTYVSGQESVATYVVTATNAVIATDSAVTFLSRATGEILKTDAVATLAADGCAAARAVVCASETKVMVSGELIAEETPAEAVPYKWTYDFESADENVKIIGAGSFVDDADAKFGKVFSNVGTALRTNYLTLPDTVLAQSAVSKELTIAFWVNANGKAVGDYPYAPFFTAYASNTNGADNTFPMLALQSRGLAQVNCAGWTDFAGTEHVNGKSNVYNQNAWEAGDAAFNFVENWLEDNEWHYYTAVYTEAGLTIYLDGEVKNQWTCDGTEGKTLAGLFSNGGDLKHICLGGNQAWNWGDNDSPFKFDDVMITNYVLTPEDIAEIIKEKTAEPEAEPMHVIDFSTQTAYPYYRMEGPEGTSFDVINGALVIENNAERANPWDLQPFICDWFNLKLDYDYVVRITMKASADGGAQLNMGTWSAAMYQQLSFTASDEYQTYEVTFPKSTVESNGNDVHILFQGGKFVGKVEIAKVEVFEIAPEIPDAIEEVEVAAPAARKYMENGKLVIIKDGKKFGVNGVAVK